VSGYCPDCGNTQCICRGMYAMGKDTGKPPIGEAYDVGGEIVILGTPPDFDDSVPDDDPRRHNCAAMGCGCAHVLYRFRKADQSNRITS